MFSVLLGFYHLSRYITQRKVMFGSQAAEFTRRRLKSRWRKPYPSVAKMLGYLRVFATHLGSDRFKHILCQGRMCRALSRMGCDLRPPI